MTPDQVAVAARCLNIDLEIATQRAQEVRDGIIRVSSDAATAVASSNFSKPNPFVIRRMKS